MSLTVSTVNGQEEDGNHGNKGTHSGESSFHVSKLSCTREWEKENPCCDYIAGKRETLQIVSLHFHSYSPLDSDTKWRCMAHPTTMLKKKGQTTAFFEGLGWEGTNSSAAQHNWAPQSTHSQ
jgi:hypothetical protein